MIYIESESRDPYFNLALEEYVFEELDPSQRYFMLWQNDNAIVVGKYQNTAQEVNQEFVDAHQIRVARRLSGGGAVYHDRGNLNFTFIVNEGDVESFNFQYFIRPVLTALNRFGVHAEFTGRNDITIEGKKISGSSQYVKRGRVLHHGCIMVDSNLTNVAAALRPKAAKFQSKSAKSVVSRVTSINTHSPELVTVERFKAALLEEVASTGTMERYCLTGEDLTRVEDLAEKKYRAWEWTYGWSGSYNYRKCEKFGFGLVEVDAEVESGVIERIRVSGDFFGRGDIADLECALMGERIDGDLGKRLGKKLDVGYYIQGMDPEQIQKLLR